MAAVDAAKKLLELQQYERSVDILREVLAEDDSDAEAWYVLGVAHHLMGQPADATTALERALTLQPTQANAHFYLGEISFVRGDFAAATDHYADAIVANPAHKSAAARLQELNRAHGTAQNAGPEGQADSRQAPKQRLQPPRPPRSWQNSVVGVVDSLHYRTEAAGGSINGRTIYNFRLQVVDRDGHADGIVGVELRGLGFRGGISNGDWVEIDRKQRSRGSDAFEIHSLRNLTTGGEVKGRRFRF